MTVSTDLKANEAPEVEIVIIDLSDWNWNSGSGEPPSERCWRCGGQVFWRRPAEWGAREWLCQRCHPCPLARDKVEWHIVEAKQVASSLVDQL